MSRRRMVTMPGFRRPGVSTAEVRNGPWEGVTTPPTGCGGYQPVSSASAAMGRVGTHPQRTRGHRLSRLWQRGPARARPPRASLDQPHESCGLESRLASGAAPRAKSSLAFLGRQRVGCEVTQPGPTEQAEPECPVVDRTVRPLRTERSSARHLRRPPESPRLHESGERPQESSPRELHALARWPSGIARSTREARERRRRRGGGAESHFASPQSSTSLDGAV